MRTRVTQAITFSLLFLTACSDQVPIPTGTARPADTKLSPVVDGGIPGAQVQPARDPVATVPAGRPVFSARGAQGASHGVPLTEVGGDGAGMVNVTPTAEGAGFTAQITVSVHGLSPNTTYLVQRSPDFPVPTWTTDGICDRAAGNFPAGVTGPIWITFPTPNPGPPVSITTSAGGAGAVSFGFDLPAAAELAFDVMFRVVDNISAPTRQLLSPCFTVNPK